MPSTRGYEVFQFDELSEHAKERAREWYREGALDYEWWDYVYDDFTTVATALGFEIEERTRGKRSERCIWFSGFCSQGDGACFEGVWRAENCRLEKLAEYLGDLSQHPDRKFVQIAQGLWEFAQAHPTYHATIKHTGHYHHSHSVSFNVEECRETEEGEEDIATLESEEDFSDLARDLMNWLYRSLESEHDYQLSDDVVDETIRINEYTFTEDGYRD